MHSLSPSRARAPHDMMPPPSFYNTWMSAFLNGETSRKVIEHQPDAGGFSHDHRRHNQLLIAARFARTVLTAPQAVNTIEGGVHALDLLASERTCVHVVNVKSPPPNMARLTTNDLLTTLTVHDALYLRRVDSFRYTQPIIISTKGLPSILGSLASISERQGAACAVMHCAANGTAIACLFIDVLQTYVVFAPCPSRNVPGITGGGPTIIFLRTLVEAMDCISKLFLGRNNGVPRSELQSLVDKDRVEAHVFSLTRRRSSESGARAGPSLD